MTELACFMRGMHMRNEAGAELVNDEGRGGCLIPMMMLYHEHETAPEKALNPIRPEQPEEVIVQTAAGLLRAYKYFREQGEVYADRPFSPHSPCNGGCPST